MKRAGLFSLAPIALDPDGSEPLHRQLYAQLRAAILSGQLKAGTRLPSSRAFAAELRLSRNTVVEAFDQLTAEGYLVGQQGSGTFVSELLTPPHSLAPRAPHLRSASPALSRRGAATSRISVSAWQSALPVRPFRQGLPAVDLFPLDTWMQLQRRYTRHVSTNALGYGDPAGYRPLREALAAYLGAARGVRCTPEQVIVVAGAQQGLDLAARLLLDPGDAAWIEEPGYRGARGALLAAGAQLVPVPVDQEGLDVQAGMATRMHPRLAYVTPSHQYPLGVTMSLARRLALLEWARRERAWILEDDYDSEFRYTGRPLAALQGLDSDGRVIYIGTMSKVLMPALRLGYLVVPESVVDAFLAARALTDRHAPLLDQVTLAEFIAQGHLARHLRRMRAIYAERQAALVRAARRELGEWLRVDPAPTGMHVVGWLLRHRDDEALATRAGQYGVETAPLSYFNLNPPAQPGLLFGYAAFSERELREGVKRLREVFLASGQPAPLIVRTGRAP